jgi:predicted metal-dependent hydrolase
MSDLPDFKLIRSNRRSISIQITPEGEVVVKAPYLVPSIIIKHFVRGKNEWIVRHLGKIHKAGVVKQKQYSQGEEFMYLGNIYKLDIGDYQEIKITDKLCFPQFLKFRIQKELNDWYIRQAREIITKRVDYHSKLMQMEYRGITFSDTSSKWGSCSRDNFLQFNWRLVMAPLQTIDYVVVHELAHTKEKNHGDRFWRIVSLYKPAYKQYRKWLNENSRRLIV